MINMKKHSTEEEAQRTLGRGRNTEEERSRKKHSHSQEEAHCTGSTEELVKTQTKRSVLAVSAALGM